MHCQFLPVVGHMSPLPTTPAHCTAYSQALADAALMFDNVSADSRIGPLLKNMNKQYVGRDFSKSSQATDKLTPDQVPFFTHPAKPSRRARRVRRVRLLGILRVLLHKHRPLPPHSPCPQVDAAADAHMPLCMKFLQQNLKRDHKVGHVVLGTGTGTGVARFEAAFLRPSPRDTLHATS